MPAAHNSYHIYGVRNLDHKKVRAIATCGLSDNYKSELL